MTETFSASRLLRLVDYIDALNIEPAGPSRNRDLFLAEECRVLRESLEHYLRIVYGDKEANDDLG